MTTAQASVLPPTTCRPVPPVRIGPWMVTIAVAAVIAGVSGALYGPVGPLWGATIGLIAAGVHRHRTNRASTASMIGMIAAGTLAGWWFNRALADRVGPLAIGDSASAALGFAFLGAIVGWTAHRRSSRARVATIAASAIAWYLAALSAVQMGTAIGYLAELSARDLDAGLVQALGSPFYFAAGALVVSIGVSTVAAIDTSRPSTVLSVVALWITVLAYNKIGFSTGSIVTQVGNLGELTGEFWPPQWTWPKSLGQPPSAVIFEPFIETLQIAVIGAVFGCMLALPLAFFASRPTAPGETTYWLAKTFMNVTRTIPDLFWAVLFATAVGFGNPFAGALAMLMFSLSIMAKLLSETVDSIDLGPLEAGKAAGAGHWSMVQYAAMPQVLPNYVAYALYIFELNIRASVVIGIVGAGGIGRLLDEQRNFFQWDRVMAIVLVIFAAVILIEIVSISVRRRLV